MVCSTRCATSRADEARSDECAHSAITDFSRWLQSSVLRAASSPLLPFQPCRVLPARAETGVVVHPRNGRVPPARQADGRRWSSRSRSRPAPCHGTIGRLRGPPGRAARSLEQVLQDHDDRDRQQRRAGRRSRPRGRSRNAVPTEAPWTRGVDILTKGPGVNGSRRRRVFEETSDWLARDDADWPCSFVRVCDALGLDVRAVRQALTHRMEQEHQRCGHVRADRPVYPPAAPYCSSFR